MDKIGRFNINNIYQGNACELIKELPDKSIDLCLTDFPYGVNLGYEGFEDTKEYVKDLIEKIMPEILRVSKVALITCGNVPEVMWSYPAPDAIIKWYIPSGAGITSWGFNTWQPILAYGKDPLLKIKSIHRKDSIEHIEQREKNGHPCAKPINIWRKILLRGSASVNDLILDPFCGSGTTAIACIKERRRFICFELSQKYIDIANKRINEELKNINLFDNQIQMKPEQQRIF